MVGGDGSISAPLGDTSRTHSAALRCNFLLSSCTLFAVLLNTVLETASSSFSMFLGKSQSY